jgi:hypothetical protein
LLIALFFISHVKAKFLINLLWNIAFNLNYN